ncbi:MAG: glutamate--tRNA ligase [Rickettsiales bacterium]|nr:glutamate--tRNA ligase [Rickettsiales bacterium]
MTIVTRFPPSPTGSLHIGSARTALFNWLYARHHGGKFILRIEDTDRKRSTTEALESIFDGLNWLGLNWDGDVTFQSANFERHTEVVSQLLESGQAYKCYCTPDELAEMREKAKIEGKRVFYDRRWRDRTPENALSEIAPVVRIKMPLEGKTTISDLVQGDVTVANEQLDDFIIMRADGSPTYMLSVVVDDHDSGVTHVIRGDDHLNNASRQYQLYCAAGWKPPKFAHIPLIHGSDGQKLSKRHGAKSVQEYQSEGILASALCNYLLRLGWSHGNEEIISREQAIEWFDLDGAGRATSRFNPAKLESLNAHYLRMTPVNVLTDLILDAYRDDKLDCNHETAVIRIKSALPLLIKKVKKTTELIDLAKFLLKRHDYPLAEAKADTLISSGLSEIREIQLVLVELEEWSEDTLNISLRALAKRMQLGLGKLAQPLRVALTGSTLSPGIFEIMMILGRTETLRRLERVPYDETH